MGFVRRYLNSSEKLHLITISGFLGEIDRILKEFRMLDRTPEALKYFKMAKTLTYKAWFILMNEVSEEEYDKVYKQASSAKFYMRYDNWKPKGEHKYAIEDDDTAMDLACAILEKWCKTCQGDNPKCTYYKLMHNWDIEPYRAVSDGKCPYSYID